MKSIYAKSFQYLLLLFLLTGLTGCMHNTVMPVALKPDDRKFVEDYVTNKFIKYDYIPPSPEYWTFNANNSEWTVEIKEPDSPSKTRIVFYWDGNGAYAETKQLIVHDKLLYDH